MCTKCEQYFLILIYHSPFELVEIFKIIRMKNLKLNHRYLIRERPCSSISELTIIEITQTSIKVKYPSGNTWWFHKELDKFWKIIEDLGINDDNLNPNRPTNPSCTTISG